MLNLTAENIALKVCGPPQRTKSKTFPATLAIGQSISPCRIRKIIYGKPEALNGNVTGDVSVVVFPPRRKSMYTDKGLVDMLVTTKTAQFFAYINVEHLHSFFGALAVNTVCANLD